MMVRRMACRRGQSIIEYAVLVAAVVMGVAAAAKVAYNTFVAHAQTIEQKEMLF